MKTEDFLNAVCEALGRDPNTITVDDSPATIEEWDSVGHLSIISTIDEQLEADVSDSELTDFDTMRQLVDRLVARNALECRIADVP